MHSLSVGSLFGSVGRLGGLIKDNLDRSVDMLIRFLKNCHCSVVDTKFWFG